MQWGTHGIALRNALDIFELNDMEKDIIKKHMWPMTAVPPKYKESFIVTCVDKYCATIEFFKYLRSGRNFSEKDDKGDK